MPSRSNVSPCPDTGRWDRQTSTALMQQYDEQKRQKDTSIRHFADIHKVPRATLQYWLKRRDLIPHHPQVVALLESPAGLALLHQILLALHLIIGWMGGGGIRLISTFLELTGLDAFLAPSYGVQQGIAADIQQALVDFAELETGRLADTMPHRDITVVEDETFLSSGICLVAIEPVSGFILTETYADSRDAQTWNETLEEATEGLDVTVVQSTADEARALGRHARDLGAHHSPDLFHISHEVSKAMALPLLRRESAALRALETAQAVLETHQQARMRYEARPPRGRRPHFEARIAEAEAEVERAGRCVVQAREHRLKWRALVQSLSVQYHPYALDSGCPQRAPQVKAALEATFDELREISTAAELSERSKKKLEKAARQIPAMLSTLEFFERSVRAHVSCLELSPQHESLLFDRLLPSAYLHRVRERSRCPDQRASLEQRVKNLLADDCVAGLCATDAARLESAAFLCADVFQRSSSCVEGRNGRLSQWEHSQRRLSPKKLAGLTVIHNFLIQRADGTTAAQRFFADKPRELFTWLLQRIPHPPRPARRRKKPAPYRLLQPLEST